MSITVFTAARHLCLSRTRNSFLFPSYFSKIYFKITPSSLLRSRKLCFRFRFPYWNLHAFLFSRIRNVYSAHLFYLYLINLIMFGDVYKSRRLSFLNYLQPPLISSHFLSFFTMVKRNFSLFLSLMSETTQISYWTECQRPHKYHTERNVKRPHKYHTERNVRDHTNIVLNRMKTMKQSSNDVINTA